MGLTTKLMSFFPMCLLCIFSFTDTYAKTAGKNNQISLKGRWHERSRSSSSTGIPVVAFVDNGFLIVQSTTLRSNITVRITDSVGVVRVFLIQAEDSGYISLDLGDMKEGDCVVELSNQWDDYISGIIFI